MSTVDKLKELYIQGKFSEILNREIFNENETVIALEVLLETGDISTASIELKNLEKNLQDKNLLLIVEYLRSKYNFIVGEVTKANDIISVIDFNLLKDLNLFFYNLARLHKEKINWKIGNFEEAEKNILNFLNQSNTDSSMFFLSEYTTLLGNIKFEEREIPTAETHYKNSLNYCLNINNTLLINRNIMKLGLIDQLSGRFDEAVQKLVQSYDVFSNNNFKIDEAKVLDNIGAIYFLQGDIEKSLINHENSLEIKQKLGIHHEIALSLGNIAILYYYQGKLESAKNLNEEILYKFEQLGNNFLISLTLISLGNVYFDLGMFETSIEKFQQAFLKMKKLKNDFYVAESLFYIIRSKLQMNNSENLNIEELLRDFPKQPFSSNNIYALENMINGFYNAAVKDFDKALKYFQASLLIRGIQQEHIVISNEKILEILMLKWLSTQGTTDLFSIKNQVTNWKDNCKKSKLFPSYCKTLIIESRIYSAEENYSSAKENLLEAIEISGKMGLPLHLELAESTLKDLDQTIIYDKMLKTYYSKVKVPETHKEVQIEEAVQLLTEFNKILTEFDK